MQTIPEETPLVDALGESEEASPSLNAERLIFSNDFRVTKKYYEVTLSLKETAKKELDRAKAAFDLVCREEEDAKDNLERLSQKINYRQQTSIIKMDIKKSCPSLLKTYQSHTHGVWTVKVLDENSFFSVDVDEILRVWDLPTGECMRELESVYYRGKNAIVPVHHDRFLCAEKDHTVTFRKFSSGIGHRTFAGHSGTVHCIAKIGDSKFLTGSEDRTIRYWNWSTGRCISQFKGHRGAVLALVSLGHNVFLSGSVDGTVRSWNTASSSSVHVFEGHVDAVVGLAPIGGGDRFVSCSRDGTIKMWNAVFGHYLKTFNGHSSPICAVKATGFGRFLSASEDKTIKLWDYSSGQCVHTYHGHSDSVESLAVYVDKKRFLSGSRDGTVKLWSLS